MAVPGQTVNDALTKRPLDDPITYVVLGEPGISTEGKNFSQVEWAEELEPTFVFLWIGNNDFLGFATSGGVVPITPPEYFEPDYLEILDRLQDTGADLVVANIPDVTSIPFFTSAEDIAESAGYPLDDIGPLLGIEGGDFVTLPGLPLIEQILANPPSGPLPREVVLDKSEVEQARQAVDRTNRFIARETYHRNIPVVDINLLFKIIEITGVPANGKLITTNFLGGLFSLDGVHPTNTGYAVIANHFIRTLNRRYRARIPRIKIREVAANDPLVIPDLLPNTRDVIRELSKGGLGDIIGPFQRALNGEYNWRIGAPN